LLQKCHVADLLNLSAIYEAQNADNARALRIGFDDKHKAVELGFKNLGFRFVKNLKNNLGF